MPVQEILPPVGGVGAVVTGGGTGVGVGVGVTGGGIGEGGVHFPSRQTVQGAAPEQTSMSFNVAQRAGVNRLTFVQICSAEVKRPSILSQVILLNCEGVLSGSS